MNIEIARINQGIEKDPKEYVRSVNEDYLYKLKKIADDIAENHNEKPVILLSGPSGSGKTTTAMMIEKLLDDMGHETHTLSMDNWFCPLTEAEKTVEGHVSHARKLLKSYMTEIYLYSLILASVLLATIA